MMDKYDLCQLTKYSVRTFDYIPQDARLDVREIYSTILTVIDQVTCGALILHSDSQEN
jgi:hypothetical protein